MEAGGAGTSALPTPSEVGSTAFGCSTYWSGFTQKLSAQSSYMGDKDK